MSKPIHYQLQAEAQCHLSLGLDFDGFRLEFRTNSETLLTQIKAYYQHFLAADDTAVEDRQIVLALQLSQTLAIAGDWQDKPPEPGKLIIKEHCLYLRPDGTLLGGRARSDNFVLRKLATEVHLFFGSGLRLCAGPLERETNQVVNFINDIHLDYLLTNKQGLLLHAAGLARSRPASSSRKLGLALTGPSGLGKSTLALKLLSRGLDFVSNDRLVLETLGEAAPHMRGIVKYPRINPGTMLHQRELTADLSAKAVARFEAMTPEALWQLEEKHDVFIEATFGVNFRLAAQLKLFILLDWTAGSDATLRIEVPEAETLPKLISNVIKTPPMMLTESHKRLTDFNATAYLRLLDGCDIFVLRGGIDFEAAADRIMGLLKRY